MPKNDSTPLPIVCAKRHEPRRPSALVSAPTAFGRSRLACCMHSRGLSLAIAVVVVVSTATHAMAQRQRRAAPRVQRATRQRTAVRPALPKNYGSMRPASRTRAVKQPLRIQPVPKSGSRTTSRGGEVEWAKSPNGKAVVRGETARGNAYGGVQSTSGKRVAAVQTSRGNVVVRARGGNKTRYRQIDDDWKEVDYVGVPYYYHSHHWYYPYYYSGEVYYEEVYPPAGAVVDALPAGAKKVTIDGIEYILWDGVYYREVEGHYKVVAPPQGNAVPAIDPLAILRNMNTFLVGLDTFVVETREVLAEPDNAGQFKQVKVERELAVYRPDKLAVRHRGSGTPREFWYNGSQIILHTPAQHVYGQLAFSGSLSKMFDMLEKDYAVTLPLSGLFRANLVDSLQPRLEQAVYVEQETVLEYGCHHVFFKTDEVEADLWIDTADSAPYPRKIVLRYPGTPGKPSYQAMFGNWKTDRQWADDTFDFSPPETARKIDMVPVIESVR
jgi:hypothetical protein